MQRRGKTACGTQRWYCPGCRTSTVRRRPDTTFAAWQRAFTAWLTGTQHLADLADDLGVSRWTLWRRFTELWESLPAPCLPASLAGQVIIVDGIYLSRTRCVLIARTPERVVAWMFCTRESTETWTQFLAPLPRPWVVVSDGQKGLLKAIQAVWFGVYQQRCLFHVMQGALAKLTQRPKTVAGCQLRRLVLDLSAVTPTAGCRGWLRRYHRWERQHDTFLRERTTGHRPDRKRPWWYTHQRLRSVQYLLRHALPELFAYTDHPTVPRTTNHVEGGLNSRIAELLHEHRGLTRSQQQTLVAYFLASKQR